jgi:hypothetical protein
MSKFENTYNEIIRKFSNKKLVRNISRFDYEILENTFLHNKTIGDIICESILPSPYMLINDIINKLKNNENEFTYDKNDLKRLSDKDWKFFNQINKLPDDFSLTIFQCSEFKLLEKYSYLSNGVGELMEFVNPANNFEEYIWIRDERLNNSNYTSESFKNLLKHELGHVWTFIFGSSDEEFKEGQGSFNNKTILNPNKFNHYQMDIFNNLYNKNLKILQHDYNYILCKNDEENANFEISIHMDNIIEILISDYLEEHINEQTTEEYLKFLFNSLENKINFYNLTLLHYYKNGKTYKNYSTTESVNNPIRRLFLIFGFGTNEQIEYFKKHVKKNLEILQILILKYR